MKRLLRIFSLFFAMSVRGETPAPEKERFFPLLLFALVSKRFLIADGGKKGGVRKGGRRKRKERPVLSARSNEQDVCARDEEEVQCVPEEGKEKRQV